MADLQLCEGKTFKGRATGQGPEMSAANAGWRSVRGGGAGGSWAGRAGRWRGGIMVLTAVVAILGLARTGAAQTQGAVAGTLDPGGALRTFEEVSKWLEAWETPTEAPLPEGCVGVWVGIRLAGRPMGAGSSIDANRLDAPPLRTLPGAVRGAMAAALETAGGVADSDVRSDKRESFLASPFRTLEIDFAHSPKRIRATSLDRVLANIRPGIDGLLLRRGQSSYAVFPAEMLAFDALPSSAMVSLLSESGAPIESVNSEIGDGTIRLWSFETMHVAQAMRNGAPSFLFRGSRPVPVESITETEIKRMGDALAEYLERTTVPYPEDPRCRILLGDYAPHSDRRIQDHASASEHGLAALALLKYAALRSTGSDAASTARGTAIGLLNLLARDEGSRLAVSQDARIAAFALLALKEVHAEDLTDDLSLLAASAQSGVDRVLPSNGKFADGLAPEDRALVAEAIGTREALDAAWLSVGVELRPLLMPWVCFGEIALARQVQAIPPRAALRSLREQVLAGQPGREVGKAAEADLIGALKYRTTMDPDWRAAHMATMCALMLGNAECTPPAERVTEIINLQRSLRFVRQLQVRDADRYRVRNADMATGGVRAGLCDQTMPTAASAAALLATTTTLEAFDRLAEVAR